MGHPLTLTASDGVRFGAYRADPTGAALGAVVVIQEIFGVNRHIRSVCDRVAAEGYVAIAPALFDRQQPGFESGYSPDEIARARRFVASPDWNAMLRDTQAAIDAVASAGPVGVVGFCLGGSIAFLAATRLEGLAAAVGFYGGAISRFADETPKVPTELHYGDQDASILAENVDDVRAKRPDVMVFTYPGAGHGFNCDERESFHEASAARAWSRTLDCFRINLAA